MQINCIKGVGRIGLWHKNGWAWTNCSKQKDRHPNIRIKKKLCTLHWKLSIFVIMKFTTIILSLLILALSMKPCSDGNNAEDKHQDEISANHNHQNDSVVYYTLICSAPLLLHTTILVLDSILLYSTICDVLPYSTMIDSTPLNPALSYPTQPNPTLPTRPYHIHTLRILY